MNKMTAANLAVVFGPNLIWSNDKTLSLSSIGKSLKKIPNLEYFEPKTTPVPRGNLPWNGSDLLKEKLKQTDILLLLTLRKDENYQYLFFFRSHQCFHRVYTVKSTWYIYPVKQDITHRIFINNHTEYWPNPTVLIHNG